MKFFFLLLFLLFSLGACRPSQKALSSSSSCADCPDHRVTNDPQEWPSYAALRFCAKGKFLLPPLPFAERVPGDYSLTKLRFGAVYLVLGNNNEVGEFIRQVTCIQGHDTMTVFLKPRNATNPLYDSIPFHPGRYFLTARYQVRNQSFVAYFKQHELELVHANPFANCLFLDRPVRTVPVANPSGYVPVTPADIFRLLLVHTQYSQVLYEMRSLAKGEKPQDG